MRQQDWLHYADRATVELREVEDGASTLGLPRSEWVFDLGSGEIDTVAANEVVESLPAHFGCGDQIIVNERRARFEWGASAGSWSLLVDVAVGMLSAGAYDLLKAELRGNGRRGKIAPEPMTESELVERAAQLVRARYGEKEHTLNATMVQLNPNEGKHEVVLVSQETRRTYTLIYEFMDDLPVAVQIRIS